MVLYLVVNLPLFRISLTALVACAPMVVSWRLLLHIEAHLIEPQPAARAPEGELGTQFRCL